MLCLALLFTVQCFAEGDPNIDGGGGDLESGTGDNYWNGQDGVRVTVLEDETFASVTTPVDFSNQVPLESTYHFGKKNKLNYRGNSNLQLQISQKYVCQKPVVSMPPIISSGGAGSIAAVKQYFAMEGTVKDIAEKTGFDYDELISGKYVLLIEPIAYFTYNGISLAMTATEAALYDQMVGGALKSKMGLLTHQNLPLAMFLERDDLGYPAYSGSITGIKSNATIISSLGLGSVRFKEIEETGKGEIEYRVNTDVITSFIVTAKEDTNPRNPASVTIKAGSYGSITFPVTMPEGASQYVWLKWHTPNNETSVTITAQSSGDITLDKSSITASIVDLNKYMPPNPTGRDRNDGFTIPTSMRSIPRKTSANWHTYSCYLVEQIFDYSERTAREKDKWFVIQIYYRTETRTYTDPYTGESYTESYQVPDKVRMGKYFYERHDYFASLNVSKAQINPDEKVPTASGKTMKSGYGFNADVGTAVSTNGSATGVQTVVGLFPEFKYDKYCRLLDRLTGGFSAAFQFKENLYSMYKQRVHFTPIWYPDGAYKTQLVVFDAWTPDGMLVTDVSDTITISGNVYDDWHIAPY